MNTSVAIAIIGAVATVSSSAITAYVTRKREGKKWLAELAASAKQEAELSGLRQVKQQIEIATDGAVGAFQRALRHRNLGAKDSAGGYNRTRQGNDQTSNTQSRKDRDDCPLLGRSERLRPFAFE